VYHRFLDEQRYIRTEHDVILAGCIEIVLFFVSQIQRKQRIDDRASVFRVNKQYLFMTCSWYTQPILTQIVLNNQLVSYQYSVCVCVRVTDNLFTSTLRFVYILLLQFTGGKFHEF